MPRPILLSLAALAIAIPAQAQVYKCTDPATGRPYRGRPGVMSMDVRRPFTGDPARPLFVCEVESSRAFHTPPPAAHFNSRLGLFYSPINSRAHFAALADMTMNIYPVRDVTIG